ncbi:hypothetical protein EDM76_01720 [bacterium]|nr:MAG: hypothetical protein EDM76_01720 [bacterium]MCE7891545.1 hypothetical protein [Sorangiineae bacterium PRO1]
MLLPVLRHDNVKAWPKPHDDPSPAVPGVIRYVEAEKAFSATYDSDAHFAAYSVPELPHRLRLLALGRPELAAGWRMELFVVDVDHPWKKEETSTEEGRADLARRVAEWWAIEEQKLAGLAAEHVGLFIYRSRSGGYRIVARLLVPVVIRTEADREAWRIRYHRELIYLKRRFGIVADPACADITRLYRLPRVTRRQGEAPTAPEMRGDPAAIGVWTHEPCDDELADDLVTARGLAADAPSAWNSVVRRLEPKRQRQRKAPPPPRPSGPRARPANDTLESCAPHEGRPPRDDDERGRMVAYAYATLDKAIERIAAAPGHITGGNNALNAGVYSLARFAPHLLDECEIRARALDAAHRCGVIARDGAEGERKALATIDSAVRAGLRKPRWPALDEAFTSDEGPPLAELPPLLTAEEANAAIVAALRSPNALVVLKSSAGAGKSARMREAVRDHVARKGRALIAVPTHDLAAQTVDALAQLDVEATAPIGVARVRLPVIGQGETTACIHADAADHLAQSHGHVRQVLCSECPARDEHPATGGTCPAYDQGAEKAPVAVLQQQLLATVLADHTERLRGGDDDAIRLAFIDEHVAPTTTTDLATALSDWRVVQRDLSDDVRERLGPLMEAVLLGADIAGDGASLRALGAAAGCDDGYLNSAFDDARTLDGAKPWAGGVLESLARLTIQSPQNTRSRTERAARVTALIDALIDAAHSPDRQALWVDEQGARRLVTPARWTRRVRPYIEAGGRVRVLDATAYEPALRALWGEAFDFVRVDVADASVVVRRYGRWANGAKGQHCYDATPRGDRLRGPLRRIALMTNEVGASVAIFAHKPVADSLRKWLDAPPDAPTPDFVPDELVALRARGVELRIGHYGAQRGLDAWADCSAVVTLGDAWPNLGEARAQARALGIDPDAWAEAQARAELEQAWGRARTVHRTTPVLVLHLGALAPTTPQWAGVEAQQARKGRTRSRPPLPSDPSTWPEERAAKGLTARQHATAIGVPWSTYCRVAKAAASATLENKGSEGGPQMETSSFSGVSEDPEGASSLSRHLRATCDPLFLAVAPPTSPPVVPSERALAPEPCDPPAPQARPRPWGPAESDLVPIAASARGGGVVAEALGALERGTAKGPKRPPPSGRRWTAIPPPRVATR